MKKRYIIGILLILLILLTANVFNLAPVRPFIQLPGEQYPGVPFFLPGGLLNTFVAALLAYVILFLIPVFAKAGSRTAEEVPTGFYNFIEMVIEGAYNFVAGVTGDKAKDFFPWFTTFILLLLISNLLGLVPGYDSIGLWEYKPHFYAEKDVKAVIADAEAQNVALIDAFLERLGPEELNALLAEHPTPTLEEMKEAYLHQQEHLYDEQNLGDVRNGILLQRASTDAVGNKQDDADWTIVPFVRPAATDLSFNLALALISMTMVQVFGFKYLGAGYLKKFFNWPSGFVNTFAKNPMQGIILILNPIVGLIELVSEFSKIISFSFRLLGAIFGGMVLLFVMASIAPIANIAFYGLELFIGLIQALVFAMLSIIFMSGATQSHHDDHH